MMRKRPTRGVLGTLAIMLVAAGCTSAPGERESQVAPTPAFEPDWGSLSQHEAAPEWFRDAKLGIYFHWGVYSVPAYSTEWYPRLMHLPGHPVWKHHLATYGHPSEFGYHDFVPKFTAEHFDPEEWADLFQQTGARFAGPVAEHHDGFSMWASEVTPWNVGSRGPKRDITGELAASLRKRGMKLITTFHHARNLQRYDSPAEGGRVRRRLQRELDEPLPALRGHAPVLRRSGAADALRQACRRPSGSRTSGWAS